MKACNDLFTTAGSAYYGNTVWYSQCLAEARAEYDQCLSTGMEAAWQKLLKELTERYLGPAAVEALARPRPSELLGYENIVGVAVEEKLTGGKPTGTMGLKVYVRQKAAASALLPECRVPSVLEGVATDVEEVGEIFAQFPDTACYPTPPSGCSVGHIGITAGTLGCVVQAGSGELFILSNNHVLANSNQAERGDLVVQPGPADGGQHSAAAHPSSLCGMTDHCVAELTDFEPLDFTGQPNAMDAAVARTLGGARTCDPAILDIGRVVGTADATRGMLVRKRGRTTGLTVGIVRSAAANIRVNYRHPPAPPLYARFDGQLSIEGTPSSFSEGGDSGSLIVDETRRAVGLLFGGSHVRTFANPIEPVLRRFGVTIV